MYIIYSNKEKYINNIYSLCNKLYNICKLINNLKDAEIKNAQALNNKLLKIPLIDISNFIYYFTIKHQRFNAVEQNDSHEFLRVILEDNNSELNVAKNKSLYTEINYDFKTTKIGQEKVFNKNFLETENSIISKIFYWEIVNIFRCKCNFESYGFQKILDIPLLNIKNLSIELIVIK